MEFIKVLCIDEYLDNSICIVNKEEISHFELQSYYREDSVMGNLFLKNGTKLLVSEEGVKPLQKELLEKTIPFKKKHNFKVSLETVDSILNPNNIWDKKVGIGDRMSEISILTSKYREEIATKIKLMSYHDFLQTPYWKAISVFMKITDKKCEICGSKFDLYTHHKTYENHGYEILHLKDLQVVCGVCHSRIHKGDKNNG